MSNMQDGAYALEAYKVSYRSNDAHTTYIDMGRPAQLSKQQVEEMNKQNDGSPFPKETIVVKDGKKISRELEIKENDVILLTLIKL